MKNGGASEKRGTLRKNGGRFGSFLQETTEASPSFAGFESVFT